MTFNGFGTQAAWPDGTGFSASDFGDISKGRTSIRDLCQGMNNCVGKINLSVILQTQNLNILVFKLIVVFSLFFQNLVGLVIAKQGFHSFPDRKSKFARTFLNAMSFKVYLTNNNLLLFTFAGRPRERKISLLFYTERYAYRLCQR